ncbi:MAG: phosphoribosyl-AMP cyclohydrolase [Rhizobiales bacterium]|nr:phosphoribosyl-AMP cyclohydrolase [Hyphomicrobiales bacterium]
MSGSQSDKHELEEGQSFTPRFDENGLIPVICTDAASGVVLMFAWMNETALHQSIETGKAWYWSRSRQKLWQKGETSGNTQVIVDMRTDCDQDVVWITVQQGGNAACHTGRKSCFYRRIEANSAEDSSVQLTPVDAERLFNPDDIYKR